MNPPIFCASAFIALNDVEKPKEVQDKKFALVVLNTPLCKQEYFENIWKKSSVWLCADGGANRLFDTFNESERIKYLPTIICGDLDSVRQDVIQWYKSKGVLIQKIPDPNATDLQKCLTMLRWLERFTLKGLAEDFLKKGLDSDLKLAQPSPEFHQGNPPSHIHDVIILGALNGRFDHTMASLNTMFLLRAGKIHEGDGGEGLGIPDNRKLYLTSDTSVATLLWPGKNRIYCRVEEEGPAIGLMPIGTSQALCVTSGLKWNLDHNLPLEFGGMVSTSNTYDDEQSRQTWAKIDVDTNVPIIFSAETHMETIRHW